MSLFVVRLASEQYEGIYKKVKRIISVNYTDDVRPTNKKLHHHYPVQTLFLPGSQPHGRECYKVNLWFCRTWLEQVYFSFVSPFVSVIQSVL